MGASMSHGEGNGTPLQHSCLENPMDGGAWWAAVHGVAKSQTRLSDFPFTLHFHALEKEMATHSSILAWRIPRMGEPGGLPSMGSHSVRHDWSDLAAAAAAAATKNETLYFPVLPGVLRMYNKNCQSITAYLFLEYADSLDSTLWWRLLAALITLHFAFHCIHSFKVILHSKFSF